MKKIKKFLIILIIIVLIVVVIKNVIVSKFNLIQNIQDETIDQAFDKYTVKRGNVESTVKAIGQITSFNIEELSIAIDERIVEILVSEGQKVEKNQEIMNVTNGDKTRTVKSEISGIFFVVESEETTKYCIYNLDDIGVKLLLPERDIAAVKVGQETKISINALNKEFDGRVEYVSSLPQNERYVVKVKIDYSDEIKFGYTAISTIFTDKKEDVISIPYDFLNMTESGKYYVYKEDVKKELEDVVYGISVENESIRTYIEVGSITTSDVEVISGLEENDEIIVIKW